MTDAELDATDRALDALGRRDPVPPDPTWHALAQLARDIDARAGALTDHTTTVTKLNQVRTRRPVRPGTPAAGTGPGRRPRRRLRLFALPLVALLACTVATAFSTSPTAPLYPLHQLLFQQPSPAAADTVRQHLASAQQSLDRARSASGTTRLAALADARDHLTRARRLLSTITDPAERIRLDVQLSKLDGQAEQLAGDGNPEDHESGQPRTQDPDPSDTRQQDHDRQHAPQTNPTPSRTENNQHDGPGHN
jgi:hypothetical protein